jgi:uroporphyrinogen decarboxylase
MRQAGRYLPEYSQARARAGSFLELCKNPDFATEVTLQPLARFALDAAILFSDILTIPDAMGLGLSFAEGEGPRFERPLRDEWENPKQMVTYPDTNLRYVLDAISQIRKALAGDVPLIGFAGSPFTLACYMIEGRSGSDFHETKRMLYQRPELLHHVLDVNARAVAAHLNAQIESGAQVVMVFDTWGGVLSGEAFHEFSLCYIEHVFAQLRREHDGQRVPRIVFTKGGGQWLESLALRCRCGGSRLGNGHWQGPDPGRRPRGFAGNLDPAVLLSAPEVIHREAGKILAGYGYGNGHVFNLGHGVSQFTPPEHVAALVETVHSGSPQFH